MKRTALLTTSLIFAFSGSIGLALAETYRPKVGIEAFGNPLKGWAPYSEDGNQSRQAAGLAYYYYSWKDLEAEPGVYNFRKLERRWEDPSAINKHVVLRLYLDFPDSPSGVPSWVINQGVALNYYNHFEVGSGLSPDYNNPKLLEPLLRLIKALGERYNNNPRVVFIILGTIGFWGEWHTWPFQNLMASENTQQRIIQAYREAFPNKKILARYPHGVTGRQSWLGYHDDFFPQDTLGQEEWKFFRAMELNSRSENWKSAPIGAEMVPNSAERQLTTNWELTKQAAKALHLTWIGPYAPSLEHNLSNLAEARRLELLRMLGYKFKIEQVRLTQSRNKKFDLSVKIKNIGIAPFYFDWPISLVFINQDGSIVKRLRVPLKLSKIISGSRGVRWKSTINLRRGSYRLAIGVEDPWLNKPNIKFANAMNKLHGWSVLGRLKIH